jgi:hypothetical protein
MVADTAQEQPSCLSVPSLLASALTGLPAARALCVRIFLLVCPSPRFVRLGQKLFKEEKDARATEATRNQAKAAITAETDV